MLADIRLMKVRVRAIPNPNPNPKPHPHPDPTQDLNFNAVRCSHYPNDERWYSTALGLG